MDEKKFQEKLDKLSFALTDLESLLTVIWHLSKTFKKMKDAALAARPKDEAEAEYLRGCAESYDFIQKTLEDELNAAL